MDRLIKFTRWEAGIYEATLLDTETYATRRIFIRRVGENVSGQRWRVETAAASFISQHYTLKDAKDSLA